MLQGQPFLIYSLAAGNEPLKALIRAVLEE
jgi:hypothetical protein